MCINYLCNIFTHQIRGYIYNVYLRETSKCTLVYIEMYPRKVVSLLKEQATFIKARIALMWIRCLTLLIQAQTIIHYAHVMNTSLAE